MQECGSAETPHPTSQSVTANFGTKRVQRPAPSHLDTRPVLC